MLKFVSKLVKSVMIAGILVATPAVVGVTAGPTAVYAADNGVPGATDKNCLNADGSIKIDCATDKGQDITKKINSFAAVLAGIVVAIAALMIIYAGFKYATSQGDPKTTEQAKMQIIGAGIGIVITMIAYLIVKIFTSL